MATTQLRYEVVDGIGWIRFNKPEILNAIDAREIERLVDVLGEASEDSEVKAVVVSSVGDAFSVGDDLKVAMEEYPKILSGEIHPINDVIEDITENLQEIPRIIRKSSKVFIAAVRGYAVGAGFEIAMDCDLIVAAENAVFGFPEMQAGMTVTGGASKLLAAIVGLNRARELMLTGEFIDAAEAWRIGLANRLVPAGEEEQVAEQIARTVMSRAPLAIAQQKRLLAHAPDSDFETVLNLEKQTISNLIVTEDYGEGITAFIENAIPGSKAGNVLAVESYEARDLTTVLKNRAAHCPDKPWIVTAEREYSYREMDSLSGRLAQGMTERGLEFGDTVLVMLPDTIDFILAWCALSKFGGIEVPVNVHNRGNPLAYLINDSLAKSMIIDVRFLDRIDALKDELNQLERLILFDELNRFDSPLLPALETRFEILRLDDLYGETDYGGPAPAYFDLMGVMYTSGTTGPSKGVMTTHAHAFEYAYGVAEMLELGENDIYGAPLPLFHIAGQFATIYASCIMGATALIAGPFSVERFWEDISKYGVTCTFLLGAMANFVYRQPETPTDADNPLERALVVPLIPEVEDFKRRFSCLVSTTWGGTEMNCPTRSGFDLANNRTCGRVAGDRYEVRIVDALDQEVPDGVPGEALVRTKVPWIMTNGYWNHPEWTEKAWRNLWHHTGDMLMRDSDGNLYFVDRVKDAIRRRGENISSMEVEYEINSHPAVLESAVFPIPADETEEEVMAVIVAKAGESIDPGKLVRYLEPRMAYFMVPRFIEVIEAMPKTPTGKIQKFELRNRGVTDTTWDRVAAGVKLAR